MDQKTTEMTDGDDMRRTRQDCSVKYDTKHDLRLLRNKPSDQNITRSTNANNMSGFEMLHVVSIGSHLWQALHSERVQEKKILARPLASFSAGAGSSPLHNMSG